MSRSGEDPDHNQTPTSDDIVDDGDDYEEEEEEVSEESELREQKARMEHLFHRISNDTVPLRVHDVLIKGNIKTKEALIEAEIQSLREASSVQELLKAASIANARLQRLDIFESVNITLDSGPAELPGTTNVIVEVVEYKNPLSGDIGVFSRPEARTWSLEGALKLKNLFGYGDLWDGSLVYGWEQMSEVSAGVYLPRFRGFPTPVTIRASLSSQDWLKFSSFKEKLAGVSLGLLSTKNHDLAYNLSWRTLTDPSQRASRPVRRQLGHNLNSALKYTYKIDKRNSPLRPTKGYAFVSTTQIGGLSPDSRCLRFLRQELDLRCAFPLGFYNAALNFGVGVGVLFPWGSGFRSKPSSLLDRFYLGGNFSPVCTLGGPTSVLGFKTRGLGPTELRRKVNDDSESSDSHPGTDFLGGDLAVTAFADLSFDLPLRVLREAGIHGHIFASAGSLNKLSENEYRNLSYQKFRESLRSSIGCGVIIPTKLFRMEVNYCHIVSQQATDQGKTGVQFSFSPPST
ncbi:hypothetical protein DCAR_0313363 [Daucus carota subsp. sativus]|uniref:Bacterial surface antigen (D15) domain-containing protein n=1 Tax=Daucus carota subsp. sativus TaxID=79200 RepID=A0AAF0WQ36_DAUCS|nr:PREDICTED: sorting and assembly machinery component 50 homolog B [Daucus carota subsp. sativus]WOG94072.1 hypothetical protein DCAR_0313363 [Daucus carota subsp. sativus]